MQPQNIPFRSISVGRDFITSMAGIDSEADIRQEFLATLD
jgi:hypothetical protein